MEEKTPKTLTLGIIVGRFQVPELTEGHQALISYCIKKYDCVLIFIGTTKNNEINEKNPLPFSAREQAVREKFLQRTLFIKELPDVGDWNKWVGLLDMKTIDFAHSLGILMDDIYMCGSRDSFICNYNEYGGQFKVDYIEPIPNISGTDVRQKIAHHYSPKWKIEERQFAIWLINQLCKNKKDATLIDPD